jgi:hypothetical protein
MRLETEQDIIAAANAGMFRRLTEEEKRKRRDPTTTDLAEFGSPERRMLVEILTAWEKRGLPDEFQDDEVRPMMNRNSGEVFLTNSDYQTAMMNGGTLEIWHNCPNCGHEGFEEDCQLTEDGCNECKPQEEEVKDGP